MSLRDRKRRITFMNRFSSATDTRAGIAATVQSTVQSTVRSALERQMAVGNGDRSFTLSSRFTARVMATIEKHCLSHTPQASVAEVAAFVERLRLEELSLVVRCEAGDEEAWRELVERFTPTVRSAARAVCAGEAEAEELASSVWAELYGWRASVESGDGEHTGSEERTGSKGKLGYYSGGGSLGGWLRAIVAQLATDGYRKSRRLVQCEDAAEIERIEYRRGQDGHVGGNEERAAAFRSSLPPSPEQALAKRETSDLIHHALNRAIAGLAAEDQLLLKLYYVDELRLREAGAVLGFHEATASRRLSALHRRIREQVTVLLIAERNLKAEDVAALFAEEAMHLETDIRRLLQIDDAPD